MNAIDVAVCHDCGIMHQMLPGWDPARLEAFYRQQYHDQHQRDLGLRAYSERYNHDRALGHQRMSQYAGLITTGRRGLDIGSANNAFVDAARAMGWQCYGIEINDTISDQATTYREPFESCHFPTRYFDFITLHDVFEHLIDPGRALAIISRCLKSDGLLVIDFPDFFDSAGRHHWRPIQHLWYLTLDQLANFVEYHGFDLIRQDSPIPGKKVLYFRRHRSHSKAQRLLMLPGMGDIYWVMIKLQDFMAKNQIHDAVVDVWDFDDRPRSIEYVDRIPFVARGDYFHNKDFRDDVFRQSYHDGPQSIFPGYKGYDYYLAVNGILRMGHSMDDPALDIGRYQTDWYFPFFVSLEERMIGQQFLSQQGPYIMTHFSDLGMFKQWEKCLGPAQAYEILDMIYRTSGRRIVLTGKHWDSGYNDELKKLDRGNILIDMVDRTALPDFLSMMMASDGMFGWCGGNTIKSTYFRKPTVMLWHDYFPDERFFVNCCPPDSLGQWYWPINISRQGPDQIMAAVKRAWTHEDRQVS